MNQSADHPRYPAYVDIGDALQLLIYKCGGNDYVLRASETYEPLADRFKLSMRARTVTRAELLNKPKRNDKKPYWHKLVQFGRLRLVEKGDLHRLGGLGLWKLTKQGRRHAAKLAASTAPGLRADRNRRMSPGRRNSYAHAQL